MTTKPIAIPPRLRPRRTLLGLLLLCYAVAGVGAIVATPQISTWYASLAKPTFHPPNWIFIPIWILLYTFMAISAWLLSREPISSRRLDALMLFAVQLLLNFFWTPIFFSFHHLTFALLDILLLDATLLLAVPVSWLVRPLAGLLLLPCLAWTLFVTAINLAILQLN